jgi:hypothetical protein
MIRDLQEGIEQAVAHLKGLGGVPDRPAGRPPAVMAVPPDVTSRGGPVTSDRPARPVSRVVNYGPRNLQAAISRVYPPGPIRRQRDAIRDQIDRALRARDRRREGGYAGQ